MELLSNHTTIKNKLIELIDECARMQIAVAWASTNHEVFKVLKDNKEKISKFVVGTHFYQTDPRFLEEFIGNENVKVIKNSGEVFHPKIYFFIINHREWKCLIGSANFTNGAMNKNEEIMICFSSEDYESETIKNDIFTKIQNWFNQAHTIDKDYIEDYKKHHKIKQKSLQALSSSSSNTARGNSYASDIFSMQWHEYFNEILLSDEHNMEGRLKVILSARELFETYDHFLDFTDVDRKKIAGFYENKSDGVDWLWFGSMKGSGLFKEQINLNNSHISLALDQIPLHTTVTEEDYLNFVDSFKLAFTDDQNRLATATRLLAMKRPDYFICLDSKNKKQFCSDFGLKAKDITLGNYWDDVVSKVLSCLWWSDEPSESVSSSEIKIWQSRVAFLDALYYNNIPRANPKKYLLNNYPDIYNDKTIKIISSRMWEKTKNISYLDNWWFKFSQDNLNEFNHFVFAGALDYENERFELIKVPISFLKNHLNNFDVNANGLMVNLYILFDTFIDVRSDAKVNFKEFILN